MKPKWCSCKAHDAEACPGPSVLGGPPCICGCHKAERRSPLDVRFDLLQRLGERVRFLPTDISDDPHASVAFTIKDGRSEIIIEYEPGEGFGLTLVGWGEDEDRTYGFESLISKINYWLDGYI